MLANDIKVSIIMPMYNVEDYISDSIESVLNQTMTEFELIIIDDNSSDHSYMIAASYAEKDPRIILKKNLAGKGASAARNYGMDASSGEYIFFLDSDDLLVHDTLEILERTAVNKQADIVIGHHSMFNEKSESVAWVLEKFPQLKLSGEKNISENPEIIQLPYCWGKLYKKAILQDVKFPTEINFGEDQVFMINAYLNASKIYLVDRIIHRYRKREGQATRSAHVFPEKYVIDIINVFKLVQDIINISDFGNKKDRDDLYCYYLNSYLFRNLFSFIANGLLSDNPTTQLRVLKEYREWIDTLDLLVLQQIKVGLENANYRIHKMLSIFNSDVKEACEELFAVVNNLGNSSDLTVRKTPRITIQTVAYNVEQYIRECAESVLNQSFADFEWVIVDNGSTDKTGEILQEYALKDSRIKLFKSERNNIIFNDELNPEFVDYIFNLKSDYWCLLDSDDYVHLDFLKLLFTAAEENNADIAVAGTEKVFENNHQPRELRRCPNFYAREITQLGDVFPEIYFMFSVEWGKLVRVPLLRELMEYRIAHSKLLKHADDTLFSMEMLRFAKSVVGVDKTLHYYRIRQNSYYHSQIDTNRYLDYVLVYQKITDLLAGWNKLTERNINFIWSKTFYSITVCLELIAKTEMLSFKDKLLGIGNILNNEMICDVSKKRGTLPHLFDASKKAMDLIMKGIEEQDIPAAMQYYTFRLFSSINLVNSSVGEKNNAFLLYISSIYDKHNTTNFGSVFLYPFLSIINKKLSKQLEEANVSSDLLVSDPSLFRDIVNSRYDNAIQLCDAHSKNKDYDILKKELLKLKAQNELFEKDMTNVFLAENINDNEMDEAVEVLLDTLDKFPLNKEALCFKLRILAGNGDLISVAETAAVLLTFYSDDAYVLEIVNYIQQELGLIEEYNYTEEAYS